MIGKRQSAGGFQWCYYKDLNKFLNKKYINLNSKKRQKKVAQYDLNDNLIAIFNSQREASEKTGVCRSSITRCCTGNRKTAGGFKWKYLEGSTTKKPQNLVGSAKLP